MESRPSAELVERVRTKMTVIRGFAQLLRRRLQRTRPRTSYIELDRISDAIVELDSILSDFEDGLQPDPRSRRKGGAIAGHAGRPRPG